MRRKNAGRLLTCSVPHKCTLQWIDGTGRFLQREAHVSTVLHVSCLYCTLSPPACVFFPQLFRTRSPAACP